MQLQFLGTEVLIPFLKADVQLCNNDLLSITKGCLINVIAQHLH